MKRDTIGQTLEVPAPAITVILRNPTAQKKAEAEEDRQPKSCERVYL